MTTLINRLIDGFKLLNSLNLSKECKVIIQTMESDVKKLKQEKDELKINLDSFKQ